MQVKFSIIRLAETPVIILEKYVVWQSIII
jgi:hypothetical protein